MYTYISDTRPDYTGAYGYSGRGISASRLPSMRRGCAASSDPCSRYRATYPAHRGTYPGHRGAYGGRPIRHTGVPRSYDVDAQLPRIHAPGTHFTLDPNPSPKPGSLDIEP
jgi:hypothetical protein